MRKVTGFEVNGTFHTTPETAAKDEITQLLDPAGETGAMGLMSAHILENRAKLTLLFEEYERLTQQRDNIRKIK